MSEEELMQAIEDAETKEELEALYSSEPIWTKGDIRINQRIGNMLFIQLC
jgi:hypothetical protein